MTTATHINQLKELYERIESQLVFAFNLEIGIVDAKYDRYLKDSAYQHKMMLAKSNERFRKINLQYGKKRF
jgi:hypothetical protein